ncbi:ribosome-binding protein 1-like [Ruditapes philippinarum]|uniref:ribosome-binding protein 1-like n=1 Tax=Ruditapes philippinarum TaxID=129788 RepID=UPI00295B38C8|nr:ribosome-binding protein 1-like [Ruditapes philippinarum]
MESEQENGTNIQNTDVQGKSATEMTQNQGADTGAEEKSAERTPKKAEDTPDNKIDSPVTPANKNADTDAEETSAERTLNQAKDIADNNMESSVTTAKEDVVAKGEPTELPPNQGDGTPNEASKEEDGTPDKTVTAGAASNKDTDQGAEKETSETQKQGGDTVANGEATKITPNQSAETAAEKTSAERTLKQTGDTDAIFKPNRGDDTPDNKLTADAASNEE